MQLKVENQIPRPLKFPRDIQTLGTGWAVRNIRRYGNTVLPSSLIDILGIKTAEKLLYAVIGEEIVIYRTDGKDGGYIAERY